MEELPIIEPDASQSDAMQAIGAAGATAGAVRLDEGFAVLSANAILATDVDEEWVGAIARLAGITFQTTPLASAAPRSASSWIA